MTTADRNILGIIVLLVAATLVSYHLVSMQIALNSLHERIEYANERQKITQERQDRIVGALDATYNLLQEHLREAGSTLRNPRMKLTPDPEPKEEPKQ